MSSTEKTAVDLEWPLLCQALADRCTSRAGAQSARALTPADTLDDARHRARCTAEALALSQQGDTLPVEGIPELGDLLPRLLRGGVGSASELHALRSLLRTAQTLRRFGNARRETHPTLAEALASDPALERLREALDFALEPDGGLADRASDELGRARRKAGEVRARVVARLEEAIARYAEGLQERYYTVRDGRYVLPVRSDSHIRVPGIVLGSSASGATLFIEPRSVTGLGNQLKVAQADVEREEERVLVALSERARAVGSSLEEAWDVVVAADVLSGQVRLATDLRARVVEPESESVLELRSVRHPLLALSGAEVVANDLRLDAGRVLVVSGPNAGGKTVALKCLGLAAWMVRSGMALPVGEGSRVGWFDPVVSDVGDDQSLARNLSTFSAHVTHLARILEVARAGALVLLDELAGGTDPEEGQALAASVLEHLCERGAAVAVTTHYELLKTLATHDERFVNASVGFDLATMRPTFTVTLGIPGASSALSVARRYGLPDGVLDRARALLPEHSLGREDVLRRIQDEQVATQVARRAAEEQTRELARLRTELEAERNLLRAREGERVSREGAALLEGLRKARLELREAEQRLKRKRAGEAEVRASQRQVDAVAAQVALGGELSPAVARKDSGPARRPAREDELRPGVRVFVPRLGSLADVVDAPARGQVRVAAGAMKLFVGLDEVQLETEVTQEPEARPASARGQRKAEAPALEAAPPSRATPLRVESNTCDVRGLRADDALAMVDAFVDRLTGRGESAGYVLHGHGTGALKAAVREHLGRSPWIERSRAAEQEDGGDAFTLFYLRSN